MRERIEKLKFNKEDSNMADKKEAKEVKVLTLAEKLSVIQAELNAPKNQYNSFGKFHYRNVESIFEGIKPYLKEYGLFLTCNDEIVVLGDRFYIKATATISDGKENISTTAYARESLTKKGMDDSQVTGATSSYARKYALGGLLALDDNEDIDSRNNTQHNPQATKPVQIQQQTPNPLTSAKNELMNAMKQAGVEVADMKGLLEFNKIDSTNLNHLQEAMNIDWADAYVKYKDSKGGE